MTLAECFFLGAFLTVIAGCASVDELRNAKDEPGPSTSFNASYEDTYDAAKEVLKYQGADILEEGPGKQYIFAKQGMSGTDSLWVSYGELIGLYFNKISPQETKLKIVEKTKLKIAIFSNEWALKIFADMRNLLKAQNKLSQKFT